MTIGKMRHRITIERKAQASDGEGGVSYTWEPHATVWASADHKSLRGAAGPAGQLMDTSQIDFMTRYSDCCASVQQGDRVMFNGRTLYVQAVANEDERRRFLRLVCVERQQG